MVPLTAAMRFDRAWNGCKCRGEPSCMVCETCMTKELMAAKLDALAEAARVICGFCAQGDQPKDANHKIASGTTICCSAWPVWLLVAEAGKAEPQ